MDVTGTDARSGYVVYGLHDPDTDDVRYVGVTGNENLRRQQYARCGGASSNSPLGEWLASLKRDGNAPRFSVLVRLTGPRAQWARGACEHAIIRFFSGRSALLNVMGNKRSRQESVS